jgi:glycine hydroxymethyltransferase
MLYSVVHYDVSAETGCIDYDQMAKIARTERPKLVTIGASAYPRAIDFKLVGEIAHSNGAYVLADIAHIAGLVATGLHQSPIPHCDFVTTTTHKTLRGPRGGMVMCVGEHARAIDSAVFPGTQGGPLMHVIAGKAVCFREALRPEFADYQRQILKNAAVLAERLMASGYHVVTGGTDNHLLLIDLRSVHGEMTGHHAQIALGRANITVNKNTVPNETRSPFEASGLRIGSPAVTTRGMGESEMVKIAALIAAVLANSTDEATIAAARDEVLAICRRFPLPR